MQPSAPIYFLDQPFANEGDKTIIPATEASSDGRATQAEGFPEITQLPVASGGIPPSRWDFNGMFFLLSQLAHWEQSGGIMTWNSELGYTPPCMVYYNKVYYVGVAESGPETDAGAITPGTDTDYWVTLWDYLSSGQNFVKSGDTVTLTGDTTGTGTFDDDGSVSIATTTNTAAKLGDSTVGGTAQGIYLNSGTAKAMSETVGSGLIPTYLSAGKVTASTSTAGGTAKPIFLNAGTLQALSDTVGSGVIPTYLSSGKITASTSTVGSTKKPIFLSSGTLKALSDTVGSSSTPVYLNAGVLTACSSVLTVSSIQLADPGYVVFSNGLIIQWGSYTETTTKTKYVGFSHDFTFPKTFPTACFAAVATGGAAYGGSISGGTYSYLVAAGFSTSHVKVTGQAEKLSGGSLQYGYIAIGY